MTQQRSEREEQVTAPRTAHTATRRQNRPGQRIASAALGLAAIGVAFMAGGTLQSHLAAARGIASSPYSPLQFADRTGLAQGEDRSPNRPKSADGGDDSDDGSVPAATFESVYSLVKEHYVDSLPTEPAMSEGALRSLLAALNDPNAMYLDADANAIFQQEAQGHFAGVGAGFFVQTFDKDGYADHKIVVVSTLPGSPAEKAGLKSHDVITHVDGKWVLGSDPFLKVNRIVQKLQDANKDSDTPEVQRESDLARRRESGGLGLFKAQMLLRGDKAIFREYHLPTDTIHLTVSRAGSPTPLAITLTPGETTVAPVTAHPLAEGGVTLKISSFTNHTADEAMAAIYSQSAALSHGLILDLRGNAGGASDGSSALQAAEQIAALFLPNGNSPLFAIEQTVGGKTKALSVAKSSSEGPIAGGGLPTFNVAVLVDGSTAGAAEALAAALTDSGRATLCGGRTFGDAIVQTVYPLPDQTSAFTLVTGRLLSPKRVGWAGVGLTPKVAIAPGASDAQILGKLTSVLQTAPHMGQYTGQVAAAPRTAETNP